MNLQVAAEEVVEIETIGPAKHDSSVQTLPQKARQLQAGTQAGNAPAVGVRATSTQGLSSLDQRSKQQAVGVQANLQSIAANEVRLTAGMHLHNDVSSARASAWVSRCICSRTHYCTYS